METPKPLLTWINVIIAAFALISVTATATWHIRADRIQQLERLLTEYKKLDGAELPILMSKLRELALAAEDQIEFGKLQQEHNALQAKYERLEGEYNAISKGIELESEVWLSKGKAVSILNKQYTLGLRYVFDDRVRVNFNGEKEDWAVGEPTPVNFEGSQYRIVVYEIDYAGERALFRVEKISSGS